MSLRVCMTIFAGEKGVEDLETFSRVEALMTAFAYSFSPLRPSFTVDGYI